MDQHRPSAGRPGLLATLLIALAVSCGRADEQRLSGVIITIDTTRPGALDIYGADRGITPNLSKLARPSVVFDRAHAVAPITLPSHVSMMTGLYPLRHGVRDNGWSQLSGDADTLAERARACGYQTAAFVAAVVLSAPYGLDQGFDVYSEPAPNSGLSTSTLTRRSSRSVTDDVLQWLGERDPDRPMFLWVHYFDPHFPYDPAETFLEQARGKPYLAEVASMDHDIGRLVDALDGALGAENYLLAVVADHGESFGRHGEPTHSAYAYQATIQVPFLLRFPDGRRAGTRSDELVSVVDVFPTFLDALELGGAGAVDGVTLAGDPIPADRGVYLESYSGFLNYGWSPLAGWVDARGKYLHSSRPEYYDLAADPEELRDLFEEQAVDVSAYRAALARLSELPRLATDSVNLDEQELEQLRSLGYASGGGEVFELPDPLAPSERPAPRDHSQHYARFSAALGLAQAGQNRAAAPLLREVLEENPGNISAAETLATCLLREERFEEIVALLGPFVQRGVNRFSSHVSLAAAHENLDQIEQARHHYGAALRLRPGEADLQSALERLGAADE